MSPYAKMRTRRDNWPRKNGELGARLRYQLRENRRVKRERDQYKREWRSSQRTSNCVCCQEMIAIFSSQGVLFLTMVFKMVISFLIQAVSATLCGLPASTKRR